MKNEMHLEFDALSVNEGFARVAVAAFAAQLDPTVDEITDVKTAVSEAVTNAIIHGYGEKRDKVIIECSVENHGITVIVEDHGCGIRDIQRAMEPFYTSKPELERSGMGFAFMEAFMDSVEVESEVGKGTRVVMQKKFQTAAGE